jgi:hypothetical protein
LSFTMAESKANPKWYISASIIPMDHPNCF